MFCALQGINQMHFLFFFFLSTEQEKEEGRKFHPVQRLSSDLATERELRLANAHPHKYRFSTELNSLFVIHALSLFNVLQVETLAQPWWPPSALQTLTTMKPSAPSGD